MGKLGQQRRNRNRMTMYNITKSNKEIESLKNKILNLEKVLSFHRIKHSDTLGLFKREISLQESYFYLKYESMTILHKKELIENEEVLHKSLQETEILRQKILFLEKENERLKLGNVSPYFTGPSHYLQKPAEFSVDQERSEESSELSTALADCQDSSTFLDSGQISRADRKDSSTHLNSGQISRADRQDSSTNLDSGQISSFDCLDSGTALDSGQRSRTDCQDSSTHLELGQRLRTRRSCRPKPTMLEPLDCAQS